MADINSILAQASELRVGINRLLRNSTYHQCGDLSGLSINTQAISFGLHTAEVKKWITQKEANAVKGFFNVEPDEPLLEQSQFYPDGITAIWIEEVSGQKPRFYIYLKINFSRLLGISNYLIMPYTVGNIRKAITVCNRILKLLPLPPKMNHLVIGQCRG